MVCAIVIAFSIYKGSIEEIEEIEERYSKDCRREVNFKQECSIYKDST